MIKKRKQGVEFKKYKIMSGDNPLNVEKKIRKEHKKDQVESDLLEIYTDDKGEISNLSEIKVRRKRPFIVSLFFSLMFLFLISLSAYWAFNYLTSQKEESFALDVKITAPSKIILGEPFFYEIEYKNLSKYDLNNIEIELNFPENFVGLESYPSANFSNNFWNLPDLNPGDGSKLKIQGMIINKEGLSNMASVKAGYEISGFSSYFKKEFFYSVSVSTIPFDIKLDFFSTVLAGEEYVLRFSFKDFKPLLNSSMILSLFSSENIEFSVIDEGVLEDSGDILSLEQIDDGVFRIIAPDVGEGTDLILENYDFYLKYKVLDRIDDAEKIEWQLKYLDANDRNLIFYEREFLLSVIKSDLHLSLFVNNDNLDQAVNFGEKLNYVVKYSNKGDKTMKDLVVMAVLESDFLDWKTLEDLNGGKVSRKTISWTSREISGLKDLEPGQGGQIEFSIKVAPFKNISFGDELQVKSYSQFSIGNMEEFEADKIRVSDNKSNSIVNKINSNFSAQEEIRYFDEDNIPVGSGPLPPSVGERSTFRTYWTIKNTLHELRDLKAEVFLPDYISWEDKYDVSAGEMQYDLVDHKVVWTLGRLPLGIDEVKIDFDISIIPTEFEYNKVLILSSGTKFEALDIETNSIIFQETDVKTTKLEDDPIAILSNDGRIKEGSVKE